MVVHHHHIEAPFIRVRDFLPVGRSAVDGDHDLHAVDALFENLGGLLAELVQREGEEPHRAVDRKRPALVAEQAVERHLVRPRRQVPAGDVHRGHGEGAHALRSHVAEPARHGLPQIARGEGIGADGYREHLGVWLGASESGASWRRVFEQLVQRGLTDVEYVVSDEHAGLVDAIRRFFPDALHQRCQVHYLRNALDHVSSPLLAEQVKNGLRDVWAAPTRGEAEQRLVRLLDALRASAPRLVEWLEATIDDTLSVYALTDPSARRHLRNTNSIEHDHMAVRRRTRVIRVFPNEASLVRLLSALAMERNEQWLGRRYLLPQEPMIRQEPQSLAA